MSRFLRINLVLILATTSFGIIIDRSSTPDLSIPISGTSIEWPGANAKNIYKINGRYIPRNIIGTRNQIYRDEAIIVFPRFKPGVPFTLGVVKLGRKGVNGKPAIAPFPSWSLQEEGNCDALQNAVDIVLDNQDIVWVLDVGKVNTLEQTVHHCPPKIVAISARTGRVLRMISLKKLVSPASRLQYFVVDYTNDGRIFLYLSDVATRAIIVYEVTENRGFRVVLPKAVTIGSPHREVLFMALVKKNSGTSFLYFTYLNSNRMYSIKTENLQSGASTSSIIDIGSKPKNIVFLGTDNGAVIFFREKGLPDVYMWNVDSKFTQDNFILVQRGNEYRLPTQVALGYKRFFWVLESNFYDYVRNTVGCPGASVILHPLVKSAEYL